MANIVSLGQLHTYWKKLADWVDGQHMPKVSVVGNGKTCTVLTVESTDEVATGSEEVITINPTEGHIATIKNVYFDVAPPSGSESGYHSIVVYQWTNNNLCHIESPNNVGIRIRNNVMDAGILTEPMSMKQMQDNLIGTKFTATTPLCILYKNLTNVAQSGARTVNIVVEEEAII